MEHGSGSPKCRVERSVTTNFADAHEFDLKNNREFPAIRGRLSRWQQPLAACGHAAAENAFKAIFVNHRGYGIFAFFVQ